jgi:hypothetical protein
VFRIIGLLRISAFKGGRVRSKATGTLTSHDEWILLFCLLACESAVSDVRVTVLSQGMVKAELNLLTF